jgi:hypothetical protein
MNFQSRVVGTIAKQESYMQHYRAHSLSKSLRSLSAIPARYYDNARELQAIRLNGSRPYQIPIYVN